MGQKSAILPATTAVLVLACTVAWSSGSSVFQAQEGWQPSVRRLLLAQHGAVAGPGSTAGEEGRQQQQQRPPLHQVLRVAGDASQLIEWLHIPKAGTSFGNTLLLWACPELEQREWVTKQGIPRKDKKGRPTLPESCIARFRPDPTARSNWFTGDHTSLVNRTQQELSNVYTFVRSPQSRLASGFHFLHSMSRLGATEAEICSYSATSTRIHTAPGVQTRMVLGETTDRFPIIRGRWREGGHHFRTTLPPSAAAAEAACARLRQFAFVGITDLWNASICLFHAEHGGELVEEVEYANVRQGGYSTVSDTVKAADCGDTADERLFECAMELFLERIGQHPQCAALLRGVPARLGSPLADQLLAAWLELHGGGSSNDSSKDRKEHR